MPKHVSFGGHLKHLSIVDLIQLLHSARKSGTLCINNGDRESQLAFKDGYVVSANHSDNSIRIGRILVEMQAITTEVLNQALLSQKLAAKNRKPLIGTLIEQGEIDRETAFRGLETLIELTIVEVVGWTKGTFVLHSDRIDISDEYRYLPEKAHQDIKLDTQVILMDALRIHDEKTYSEETTDPSPIAEGHSVDEAPKSRVENLAISAEDLGLANLDSLERKIPQVFSTLEVFDPSDIHRERISHILPHLSSDQQNELVFFLTGCSTTEDHDEGFVKIGELSRAVILFTHDELLKHSLTTICKHDRILVFTASEKTEFEDMIDRSLRRGSSLLLVLDSSENAQEGHSANDLSTLHRLLRDRYEQLPSIQLDSKADGLSSLNAYRDGVMAILPKPSNNSQSEHFGTEFVTFLEVCRSYIRRHFDSSDEQLVSRLGNHMSRIRDLGSASEVSSSFLEFLSQIFERTVSFVVRDRELIAEGWMGIDPDLSAAENQIERLRIPLDKPSIFRRAIEIAELYYGECDDKLLSTYLFSAIDPPRSSKILLLPLKSREKAIALIYGDFGVKTPTSVRIDLLRILSNHVGLVLDNLIYRRLLAKSLKEKGIPATAQDS